MPLGSVSSDVNTEGDDRRERGEREKKTEKGNGVRKHTVGIGLVVLQVRVRLITAVVDPVVIPKIKIRLRHASPRIRRASLADHLGELRHGF
jgi:hypothetical protein